MRTVRAQAPGRLPRRRRPTVLHNVLPAAAAPVHWLRPAPHGHRDHRRRAGLRPLLCPAATAVRPVRPHPPDRGAGQGRRPGLVRLVPPRAVGGVLAVRAAPHLDTTTYVRVAYRHLAGEPVEFSGRVLQHIDTPVSACPHTAQPNGGRPPTHLSADRPRRNRQNAHEGTGRSPMALLRDRPGDPVTSSRYPTSSGQPRCAAY